MHRDEYLESPHVNDFIAFVEKYLGSKGNITTGFKHSYNLSRGQRTHYEFTSLYDAYLKYEWAGSSFSENSKVLGNLARSISSALKTNEDTELDLLIACLETLEWGEVYRGSVGWLAKQARNRSLKESLKKAISLISGPDYCNHPQNLFSNNATLRSDSGMTKIYALLGKSSIIYDNRVGAALGLFAGAYWKRTSAFRDENKALPDTLAFMCGDASTKARIPPESEAIRFTRKRTGSTHALWNQRANWIVLELINKDSFNWGDLSCDTQKIRALEAALFMVGYKVSKESSTTIFATS